LVEIVEVQWNYVLRSVVLRQGSYLGASSARPVENSALSRLRHLLSG
jgi:hypothetical protein